MSLEDLLMTFNDIREYLTPALHGLGMESTVNGGRQLDILLGLDEYENYQSSMVDYAVPRKLTLELQNLYRALAGPHAHTVLKMWRIKKGLEHETTEVETYCANGE